MTEIYLGGSFHIDVDIELTDKQVDELYHKLNGLVIEVTLPVALADMLGVGVRHSDWIDEVEVIN